VDQTEILQHFRATHALLEGHFVLSSGLHSPKYLQCALALRDPADAVRYGEAIADHFRHSAEKSPVATDLGSELPIDAVASPAIGGLVIGLGVAMALGAPFIWTERQNGEMRLRRGFTLAEGERILVVEDVITTGGSTRECISALEANGGKVVAAASIIDRSNGAADVGVPRISLVSLDVPAYSPDVCPMCERGDTLIKPGSRSGGRPLRFV